MAIDPSLDDPRAWIRVLVARYKDRLQAAEDDGAQEAVSAYREIVEDLEEFLDEKPAPRLPRRVIIQRESIAVACTVVDIAQLVVHLRTLSEGIDLGIHETYEFSLQTGERIPTPWAVPNWKINPVDLAALQNASR